MKNLKFIILLLGFNAIAQINAPGDCIDAYRLCDANVSYNFQLVDAGIIDDAHGVLSVPVAMPQTSINQWESKSAWIKFTPKYSGTFGFRIYPETIEKLNWMLCINPNCGNIETGSYRVVEQGSPNLSNQIFGGTGIGIDPYLGIYTDSARLRRYGGQVGPRGTSNASRPTFTSSSPSKPP